MGGSKSVACLWLKAIDSTAAAISDLFCFVKSMCIRTYTHTHERASPSVVKGLWNGLGNKNRWSDNTKKVADSATGWNEQQQQQSLGSKSCQDLALWAELDAQQQQKCQHRLRRQDGLGIFFPPIPSNLAPSFISKCKEIANLNFDIRANGVGRWGFKNSEFEAIQNRLSAMVGWMKEELNRSDWVCVSVCVYIWQNGFE